MWQPGRLGACPRVRGRATGTEGKLTAADAGERQRGAVRLFQTGGGRTCVCRAGEGSPGGGSPGGGAAAGPLQGCRAAGPRPTIHPHCPEAFRPRGVIILLTWGQRRRDYPRRCLRIPCALEAYKASRARRSSGRRSRQEQKAVAVRFRSPPNTVQCGSCRIQT